MTEDRLAPEQIEKCLDLASLVWNTRLGARLLPEEARLFWLAVTELKRWREWSRECGCMEDSGAPSHGGGYYEIWHPCERLAEMEGE